MKAKHSSDIATMKTENSARSKVQIEKEKNIDAYHMVNAKKREFEKSNAQRHHSFVSVAGILNSINSASAPE